jgi:hypothetical protein
MIMLLRTGAYELAETKNGIKLLHLGTKTYAWIVAPRIGSLLIFSSLPHVEREVLSKGIFRLYKVVDEPHLSDQLHLEVEVGKDVWQGYLLPTGLPNREASRKLVIPTREIITHNPYFHKIEAARDHRPTATPA